FEERQTKKIAKVKMPDRNGVENDEKKMAMAATSMTSSQPSATALSTFSSNEKPELHSMTARATAKAATRSVKVTTMPRYLPRTNSWRWMGLARMAWMVRFSISA